MPIVPTYPGIYIEEVPSAVHTITPAPTSIAVFIGYPHPFQGECAKHDKWGVPLEVLNFADYERKFGALFTSDTLDTNLGHAVNSFFRNGGSRAHVVGLRPEYVNADDELDSTFVAAAFGDMDGIKFTSQQVTDDDHPIKITRWNKREVGGIEYADLMITFGGEVEAYRGVQKADATAGNYIEDRINQSSKLVKIAPLVPPNYGNTFNSSSAEIELGSMPGSPYANTTMLRTAAFLDVFKRNSELDKLPIFNLLAIPGVTIGLVVNRAVEFCEDKRAFFIMDPPLMSSADGFGDAQLDTIDDDFADSLAKVKDAALYFPYLASRDPVSNRVINVPPSGAVAGIFARTDRTRGVWKAPAGLEAGVRNTTGVVEWGKMTDMQHGSLNPKGINVIRSFPGLEPVVWGARTLATANPALKTPWGYVSVRRMALFLEQTLMRNLTWAVFEPNAEPLWGAIRLSVESFMMSLYRQDAFFGNTPGEAFRVRCGRDTTTDEEIDRGVVNVEVGFRPLKPAEFVIVKIAQLAGQAA